MTQAPYKRLTLQDVAHAAGVSRATTWRALNQPDVVSPDTVRQVKDAIARIGYVPDLVAKTFKGGLGGPVALILPRFSSVFSLLCEGFTETTGMAGQGVMIGTADYNGETEYRIVQEMLGHRVQALVLTGNDQQDKTRKLLQNEPCPILQLWDIEGPPIGTMIGFSNTDVGRAAAHHLISTGRRNIATISTSDRPRATHRQHGFRTAILDAGLAFSADHEIKVHEKTRDLSDAMAQLFDRLPALDGLFVNGDLLAIQALNWCRRSGRDVPGDLGILGLGNHEFAGLVDPGLSSIEMPAIPVGRMAGQMVSDIAKGKMPDGGRHDLGCHVIRRGTT